MAIWSFKVFSPKSSVVSEGSDCRRLASSSLDIDEQYILMQISLAISFTVKLVTVSLPINLEPSYLYWYNLIHIPTFALGTLVVILHLFSLKIIK